MKLALIGYGKMGKAIEAIAKEKGHEIVLVIHSGNVQELTKENLSKADVAIECTGPHSAYQNIICCLEAGLPVVCGSTGWLHQYEAVVEKTHSCSGSFLYASNFSIGVNILFAINRQLAALMNKQPMYDVTINEVHHTGKKDAPSGTAISLAQQILAEVQRKTKWTNHLPAATEELLISSERQDPAPGTHTVLYHSEIDDIEIRHTAHSREGFARGALLAAAFLYTRRGVYTMKDVLEL